MKIFLYVVAPILYFGWGLLWGYFRWRRYVDQELDYYDLERQKFLSLNRIRGVDIPDFLVFEWRSYVKGNQRLKAVPPKAVDFRGEITYDVVMWPFALMFAIVAGLYKAVWKWTLAEYSKVINGKIDRIRKDLEG